MTQQEKDKIHLIAEQKMQELESTGLSRQEIISDKRVKAGVKLAQDPFFQFFKNNRAAREMMIKDGEEFTVQKIMDLVLKQDIGADPSMAAYPKKKYVQSSEHP
jgi:hypothetical protein